MDLDMGLMSSLEDDLEEGESWMTGGCARLSCFRFNLEGYSYSHLHQLVHYMHFVVFQYTRHFVIQHFQIRKFRNASL